jgi:hypothetical protein
VSHLLSANSPFEAEPFTKISKANTLIDIHGPPQLLNKSTTFFLPYPIEYLFPWDFPSPSELFSCSWTGQDGALLVFKICA